MTSSEERSTRIPDTLPVLPIRDQVIYPYMMMPLFVGRERSVRALEEAMERDHYILLVTQRSVDVDDPKPEDLYEVGTVGESMQMLKLPDGTIRIVIEGIARVRIAEYLQEEPFHRVRVEVLPEQAESSLELEALEDNANMRPSNIAKYVLALSHRTPEEIEAKLKETEG